MIDSRELRIGNLVERKTNEGVHIGYAVVHYVERGSYGKLPSSDCFPIEITEKWLLDFGFIITVSIAQERFMIL